MKFTIKSIVEGILLEEKEEKEEKKEKKEKEEKKDEPKFTKGGSKVDIEASTGSGGFSKGVSEAGALAKEDPESLMKNLGISSASGSDDLEKIESLVKQAITGTDAMKRVYSSMSRLTKGDKKGIKISVQEIKARDGVKYMYHTLVGARNAKVLTIDSLIQIENFQGDVIIYQGSKRSWG